MTEKLGTKTGWQKVFLEEENHAGYVGELQDFVECAAYGRQPPFRFCAGFRTIELVYAAYRSALGGQKDYWICNTVRGGL